ncbi:MAG: hypothetical protein IJ737_00650 [Ruminococcus sp.]|nr:hypothetical protein [Ruminococcus sp.]
MLKEKYLTPVLAGVLALLIILNIVGFATAGKGDKKSSSTASASSSAGDLAALEAHLKSRNAISGTPTELNAAEYKCTRAVEYPGCVRLFEYDKNSEGYQELLAGELEDSDGVAILFQGYKQTNTKCFCYQFVLGGLDIDSQKAFLDAFMDFKG